MAVPDDDSLLAAVKALRLQDAQLARAKVLRKLKEENNWQLSEKRLKACMDANNLNSALQTITPASATTKFKARDAFYHQVVKSAFQDYASREREFWLTLTIEEYAGLQETRAGIASHWRHHVELLFTLKGIKPCNIIQHPRHTNLFTRLANECLEPVIKKYSLESYGFALRQVQKHTLGAFGTWKGGWVFADITSPLWPEIQSWLLPTADLRIPRENGKLLEYEDTIGKLLGYPMRYPRCREADQQLVNFHDETEREILRRLLPGKKLCCAHGTKYKDDVGNVTTWTTILEHYDACVAAMASVDHKLGINLYSHPALREFYLIEWLGNKYGILRA